MQREPSPANFGVMDAPELPEEGRLYRHWKGDLYRVICVSRLSEQRDQVVVTYRSMLKQTNWTRPFDGPQGWNEVVTWPDGVRRPRFTAEAQITLEAINASLV